jgi:hypothetical protein
MSSKDRALKTSIYSRLGTTSKGWKSSWGKERGTPLQRADVMDRAGLDIPLRKRTADAAVVHSLHGQIRATPN